MKATIKKLTKTIGALRFCSKFLNSSVLKLLYNSLFLPHLNYGILSWGLNPSSAEFQRISKLQKWAIRLISNNPKLTHHLPLCKDMNILSLTDIPKLRCFKILKLWQNNSLPYPIQNKIVSIYNSSRRSHRFSDNLLIPNCYLETSRNHFFSYCSHLFNNLPNSIKYSSSGRLVSCHKFKKYLLNAYPDCCPNINSYCYVCNN